MVRPFLSSVAWSEAAPSGETEDQLDGHEALSTVGRAGAQYASPAGNAINYALAVHLKVEPVLPQVCGRWRSRVQFRVERASAARPARWASSSE
jgi:hypothetical protein